MPAVVSVMHYYKHQPRRVLVLVEVGALFAVMKCFISGRTRKQLLHLCTARDSRSRERLERAMVAEVATVAAVAGVTLRVLHCRHDL